MELIMWNIKKEYDVIVCGAGMAGCCAALAAAETGAKILLIEQDSGPGGVAVSGGCPTFMGFGDNNRQYIAGIAEKIIHRMDKTGLMAETNEEGKIADTVAGRPLLHTYSLPEPQLTVLLNRMLQEAGIDLLYYTTVIEAEVRERRIQTIKLFCTGKSERIHAKMFVDATGDAVLSKLVGCPTIDSSPEDTMTKTIMFKVGNVKSYNKPDLRRRFAAACAAGRFPLPGQDRFMGGPIGNTGEIQLNITLTSGNALDPVDLTRMDIELREQVFIALDWLRKEFVEFSDCRLLCVAPKIGVRAGRNIFAREMITCEDVLNATPVAEPIAVGRRSMGGHGLKGFHNPWEKDVTKQRGIPYGALLPQDIDNLLVGGRCIGVEIRVISSIRMIPVCMATGHAAGTAAALSAVNGFHVPYEQLKNKLLEQNAILSLSR